MSVNTPTPTAARRWQDVTKERGVSLRVLGEIVGRPHSTMLAYSCGARQIPQVLLDKIAVVFGEPVQ